ncbi:MAG TPA: hypothetical protein VNL69_13220 [Bacteroidota bacterium]|nr:hypothetical protein [Bacteroidota bacterium]
MYVPPKLIREVRRTPGLIAVEHAAGVSLRSVPESTRVFSPQVAYLLTDILSDAQARAPAFGAHSSLSLPFPCAAKTGTSKDYRDNWTVGYTPRYTVAVWVGNFSARPMKLVSGVTGAAPLFRDVMLFLHQGEREDAHFVRPQGLVSQRVCPRSGMKPGRWCPGEVSELFVASTAPTQTCTIHRVFRLDSRNGLLATQATPKECVVERVFELLPPIYDRWMDEEGIARPPIVVSTEVRRSQHASGKAGLAIHSPSSGEVFKLDPILRPQYQTIVVESLVPPGVEDVKLYIDGRAVASLTPPYRYRLPLVSLKKGTITLQVKGRENARAVQSTPITIAVQ